MCFVLFGSDRVRVHFSQPLLSSNILMLFGVYLAVQTALALSQAETLSSLHDRVEVLGRIAKSPGEYLANTSQEFTPRLDLPTAIHKLEVLACEVLRAKMARIYIYDAEGSRMWHVKSETMNKDGRLTSVLTKCYFNLTSSIAAVTARHREPIYLRSGSSDHNFNEEVDIPVSHEPLACAPIVSMKDKKLMGVVQISPSGSTKAVDEGHTTKWGTAIW